MNREELKKAINDMLKTNSKQVVSRLINGKKYTEIKESILKETQYLPEGTIIGERLYNILNDLYERSICPTCKINYLKYYNGRYRTHCSAICSSNNKEVQEKKKQSCLEIYGYENPGQSKEVQNKIKKTCLEIYGSECSLHNKEIHEKIKQTNKEKFGYEYPIQNKEIQEKQKQTNKEKFGYEYPMQNKEIREKHKQTMLERHGVEHALQNKEIQEKQKQTNKEKFGYEYPMQNKEIQEKQKQTNKEKFGYEYPMQNKEIQEKQKQTILEKNNKKYKEYLDTINLKLVITDNVTSRENNIFECLKCGKLFESSLTVIYNGRRCPYCSTEHTQSKAENEIFEFLKSILPNIETVQNETQIIKNPKTKMPLELDFYISEKKIAIEYNGLYWHSELHQTKEYHLLKTNLCKEKGIRLIHIFEDEWVYKKDIVKLRLKNILIGNDIEEHIVIKEINNRTSNKFLGKYHIGGNSNSSIKLGAFYNNELISVMTFLNSEGIYNIDRYHSNYDNTVTDKLLHHFKENYEWNEINVCVDLRWSNGEMFESMGFELIDQTNPNCWYFKNHELKRVDEFQLKERLADSKDDIEKDLRKKKYYKIYDCGYLKFNLKNTGNKDL